MFNKPHNLKGLAVNLVLGLLSNVSAFRFFFSFLKLWIALTLYVINFKITNLY